MTIKVTQHHIDTGEPNCSTECPIALALIEAGLGNVQVTPLWIKVKGKGSFRKEIETTRELSKKIVGFDRGGHMEPFEFELVL